MAKRYEVTRSVRLVNAFTAWMARRGLGRTELLITRGRRTGEPRPVPVSPITLDGVDYLVSPYGEVGWVRNVRAHPRARLRHGRIEREVRLEELSGPEAAPVIASYHAREPFARPYMDVPEGATVDDLAERAAAFPVFRVVGG